MLRHETSAILATVDSEVHDNAPEFLNSPLLISSSTKKAIGSVGVDMDQWSRPLHMNVIHTETQMPTPQLENAQKPDAVSFGPDAEGEPTLTIDVQRLREQAEESVRASEGATNPDIEASVFVIAGLFRAHQYLRKRTLAERFAEWRQRRQEVPGLSLRRLAGTAFKGGVVNGHLVTRPETPADRETRAAYQRDERDVKARRRAWDFDQDGARWGQSTRKFAAACRRAMLAGEVEPIVTFG